MGTPDLERLFPVITEIPCYTISIAVQKGDDFFRDDFVGRPRFKPARTSRHATPSAQPAQPAYRTATPPQPAYRKATPPQQPSRRPSQTYSGDYYQNEAPSSAGSASSRAPHRGEWKKCWDEHAQSFYYVNRITNESQWEDPEQQQEESEWVSYWDQSQGGYYYYNTRTGEVTSPSLGLLA